MRLWGGKGEGVSGVFEGVKWMVLGVNRGRGGRNSANSISIFEYFSAQHIHSL